MVVDYSEDREMLTLLRRGEISAFVDIYTTYFDALLNYADRLLNDMEAARIFLFLLKLIFLNQFIMAA